MVYKGLSWSWATASFISQQIILFPVHSLHWCWSYLFWRPRINSAQVNTASGSHCLQVLTAHRPSPRLLSLQLQLQLSFVLFCFSLKWNDLSIPLPTISPSVTLLLIVVTHFKDHVWEPYWTNPGRNSKQVNANHSWYLLLLIHL